MAKEKKAFAWDTEDLIGMVVEGPKVEHDIKKCTLNGVEFISVTKRVLKADGWEIKKNQNFKAEVFNKIMDTVKANS